MMKRLLEKYWLWLFLYLGFLILALTPYYQNSTVILGQEGNNFLDFSVYLKSYLFSWQTKVGTGFFNPSVNTTFPNIYLLIGLEELINNPQVVNFILVLAIYFMPFLGIFLVCRELKITAFLSFLLSLFYVVNPFTTYYLFSNLNHWNILSLFAIPLFFWLILKFYSRNFKLFLSIGLGSLALAFVNVNPPLMIINQIAIFLSTVIVSYYFKKRISLPEITRKYLLVLTSFFLFNFWWIINWFYLFYDLQEGYTKQFAISWLRGSGKFIPALWRTLTLTQLLSYPLDSGENSLVRHYSHFFTPLFLVIPLLIIFYFLLSKKKIKRFNLFLGLVFLIVGFFSKGVRGIFGEIYELLVMNLPLFSILKTAPEKWGVLFVFLLALYLIFIFKEEEKKKIFFGLILLVIYVVYFSLPLATTNFLPDSRINEQIVSSKIFLDKGEYQEAREQLNEDPLQYRVLAFPGSSNYQVALQVENRKFYTGYDPILNNINKAFITPYTGSYTQRFHALFDVISTSNYFNLFPFYNIKKIIINKDAYPWLGKRERESPAEIEAKLDPVLESAKNNIIDLYDLGKFYLPRFYLPEKIVYVSSWEEDDFPLIVESTPDLTLRTAFYFQEKDEDQEELLFQHSSELAVVGENQSAIDEVNLRTGVRGLNPEGVLFPYARWKPGSFIFPLVEKKEEKIKKQFQDDPQGMFEQNLFFAGKRIYEIQRWEGSMEEEDYQKTLEKYKDEMFAAIEGLEKLTEAEEDTFMLLAKIEVGYEAQQRRLLDVLSGNYGELENERTNLARLVLSMIDSRLGQLVKKYFYYPKYFFQIPEDGEYEIWVENLGLSSKWQIKEANGEREGPVIGLPQFLVDESEWISFGKRQFRQGEFYLELDKPPAENLLTHNWQGGDLVKPDEESEVFELFGVVSQEVKSLKSETIYRLSFDYHTINGKLMLTLEEKNALGLDSRWFDEGVVEVKEEIFKPLEMRLDSQKKWKPFGATIKTSKKTQSIKLFLAALPTTGEGFKVKLRNIKFEPIIEPQIILRKSLDSDRLFTPRITFQKINATKYLVEVENATGPFFLIFSESFHRGWQAYISQTAKDNQPVVASYFDNQIGEKEQKDTFFDRNIFASWGKKSLPENQHLVINGYANGWYLTPEDSQGSQNYQIIIEYWPQRLVILGLFVSLATIIFTLAVGIFLGLVSRKGERK